MKFLEHHLDFVRGVDGNVHSSGEAAFAAAQDHCGNLIALFDSLNGLQQFVHRLEVNYIERWMVEGDAGDGRVEFQYQPFC